MSAYPIPVPQSPASVMTRLPVDQLRLAQQLQMAQAQQAQQAQGVQATPAPNLSAAMPSGGMPSLPAATPPNVLDPASPAARLGTDQNELKRLQSTGSGIDQITHPVDQTTGLPTTQQPSLLRRFGGAMARIGSVGADLALGSGAAIIPGTDLHHQMLVNNQTAQVNNDLGDEEKQAQTQLLNAQPELKQQAAEIQQMRAMGYLQHVNDQATHWDDQTDAQLAEHGYKRDPQTGKTVPMTYQELPPNLQAVEDLKQSQAELADASKAYTDAKTKNMPLQMQMAAQRIATAQRNAVTAMGNLGVRQSEYNMHAYGTDASGQNELPGVLHDSNGNAVGSVQAGNVKPTTTERDAAGRAEDLTAIQARIQAGLQDPEIRAYLGPVAGRLAEAQGSLGTLPTKVAQFQNDLVSYGAFQAGLHPVRGIGALQYFDKVMGGLHQTPEELAGKLASNAATAGTVQQEGTMPTAGGLQRRGTAPNAPQGGVQTLTDGGVTYRIPSSQVSDFKKDHPNAR